jgi:outer membrane protein assembly factor BamB
MLITTLFSLLLFAVEVDSETGLLRQKGEQKHEPDSVSLRHSAELLSQGAGNDSLPLTVSPNRLLFSVGDRLYMLNEKKEVVWSHSFGGNNVTDVTFDKRDTIYATVLDGLLIALDTSGNKVWSNFLNGSGNYVQIECFGDDGFLAVVDMSAYRDRFDTEDALQLWKGREFVWSKEFPRGADLYVWGDKILAMTKTKDGITIKEIR